MILWLFLLKTVTGHPALNDSFNNVGGIQSSPMGVSTNRLTKPKLTLAIGYTKRDLKGDAGGISGPLAALKGRPKFG